MSKDTDALLAFIKPEWHQQFLRFVETGEADDGFLSYLDEDQNCQRAVESAFNAQAAAFENFARALNKAESAQSKQPEDNIRAATVSANLANAFEITVDLSAKDQNLILQNAVAALKASLEPEKRDKLREVVEHFEKKVAAI